MLVTHHILNKVYPKRLPNSKKGDFGHLLVIGGTYTGAPALVAKAALRAGTDTIHVAAPKQQAMIIAGFSSDIIIKPLPSKTIDKKAISIIKQLAETADAICIGSGLGEHDSKAVRDFLYIIKKPAVVDAEAIKDAPKNKHLVLTPNHKELSATIEKIACHYGAVILKGPEDEISDGIQTTINKTGNPFMTVGGTGDVLAGICGSLLAQGVDMFDAAQAAAYICGAAGDLAAKKLGPAMTASDVIEEIANVIPN
jgi:NAD(P)H-hydrate epimerase